MTADPESVEVLAALAGLALPPDRIAAVSEILSAWLEGANDLSRKMAEPAFQTVPPVTVFAHPLPEEDSL